MSTLLLCYYSMGWFFAASAIRGYFDEDELTLGTLLALIFLWPIAIFAYAAELLPASVTEFIVWRKK